MKVSIRSNVVRDLAPSVSYKRAADNHSYRRLELSRPFGDIYLELWEREDQDIIRPLLRAALKELDLHHATADLQKEVKADAKASSYVGVGATAGEAKADYASKKAAAKAPNLTPLTAGEHHTAALLIQMLTGMTFSRAWDEAEKTWDVYRKEVASRGT